MPTPLYPREEGYADAIARRPIAPALHSDPSMKAREYLIGYALGDWALANPPPPASSSSDS